MRFQIKKILDKIFNYYLSEFGKILPSVGDN